MNCKNCKKQGCSLAGKSHEMSFECKAYIGKTNADRIRTMSDEELADYFSELSCFPGANRDVCRGVANCMDCWLDWLKQEVNNG